SDKRLKAIELNEKARQRELSSRSDEFEAELHGFVAGKKLKRTGGAEEVERIRQRKDGMAFKAMFSGGGPIGGGNIGDTGGGGASAFPGGLPGLAAAPPLSDSEEELSPVESPIN
ncbi:15450_t:CDS:1, partial [Acaulospora colombiana]